MSKTKRSISNWKLLEVWKPLCALVFPLVWTVIEIPLHRSKINNLTNSRLDEDEREKLIEKEFLKWKAKGRGSTGGGIISIALCVPSGLMHYIHSDYGKFSDVCKQDFSKLDGSGSAWDKFTSQAMKDDVLNVFLCILFIAVCTIAGKALFLGAAAYNYREEDDFIGIGEVAKETLLGSSAEFFSEVRKTPIVKGIKKSLNCLHFSSKEKARLISDANESYNLTSMVDEREETSFFGKPSVQSMNIISSN